MKKKTIICDYELLCFCSSEEHFLKLKNFIGEENIKKIQRKEFKPVREFKGKSKVDC